MVASLIAALALVGAEEPQVVATAPRGDAAQAALAAPAEEVQSVVTGQSTLSQDLSADEQIASWLSARAPDRRDSEAPLWDDAPTERRMRGEVSAGIGTGGYRDFSAWASMPLGEHAELTIGFSQTRNDPWSWGRGYGYDALGPFGYDPYRPFGWITADGYRGRHGFDVRRDYGVRATSSPTSAHPTDRRSPLDAPGRP